MVTKRGGRPFFMPKKNASFRARWCQAWKDMMNYRRDHPRAFKNRYHKRSNSESVNSSFKGKYGERLYSMVWHMQKREAGLKVITYNLR
jgi:transposase